MNKISRKIKSKWNEIFHASKTTVTPKGLALTTYINDKYFTNEKPDNFIETYHNAIKHTEKMLAGTNFFNSFHSKNNEETVELSAEDKEATAAFITVVLLASSCNNAGKAEIYKRITDPTSLEAVKFFIAQGIVVGM